MNQHNNNNRSIVALMTIIMMMTMTITTGVKAQPTYSLSSWYNSSECHGDSLVEIELYQSGYCEQVSSQSQQYECQDDGVLFMEFYDSRCNSPKSKQLFPFETCSTRNSSFTQSQCASQSQVNSMIHGMTSVFFYSAPNCNNDQSSPYKMIVSPEPICLSYMRTLNKCDDGNLYQATCDDELCLLCSDYQQVDPFCLAPDGMYFGCP
ncbi:hypothetical protein SAMD00019534_016570 [Acytostelium subglobosum LB1]|uniref:hypothetical protein n=1 Tax=Acytostelium subglobosum LB1 TaxID=1410327 RepID=UPI000644BD25|nr:hypothetical protein SAMD00019534_016570 [Acytostelium subglobosum LB1]GAM18482.1 hypothetical protein SAMD00019534_016570 [Acytostelium subglobosum LB1]|eukprot:XP_012757702.1 hypothetical protein SAMD00019534_016570 [Acytostelium subglobosum LB1]